MPTGAPRTHVPPPADEDCGRCGAVLPSDAQFCEECGTATTAESGPRRNTTPEERVLVSRKIRTALSLLGVYRSLYRFIAVISVLAFALFLYLGRGAGSDSTLAVILIGTTGITAVWSVAALFLIDAFPVLCAVVLAAVWTLAAMVNLVATGELRSVRVLVLPIALWFGVAPLLRLRAFLREYPDLFVVRSGTGGPTARPRGTTILALREKERRKRAAALKKVGIWGGGTLVVALLVAGILFSATRIPPVDATAAEFATAWSAGRWEDVHARFDAESRERLSSGLQRILKKRKWDARPPALGTPRIVVAADVVRTVYTVDDGEITATWEYRGDRWVLRGIRFPERL